MFDLPSLRHFVLRYHRTRIGLWEHARCFPIIRAPLLQTLDVKIAPEVISRPLSLCLSSPDLTSIRFDVELVLEHDPRHELGPAGSEQIERFLAALAGDKWPNLVELLYTGPCAGDGLLAKLNNRRPPRPLHTLTCLVATCDLPHVADVFTTHKSLTALKLDFAGERKPRVMTAAPCVVSELLSLSLAVGDDSIFGTFSFPKLRELRVGHGWMLLSSLSVVLDACPLLEVLSIDNSIAQFNSWAISKPHNTLRSLEFGTLERLPSHTLFDLLRFFPNLQ